MSATTDTFARFVDLRAVTLDDHEASGEALTSRLHLSRFHFDRLVSAASGEPPATLRRRVLLERAAYQLITTEREVLMLNRASEMRDAVLDERIEISVESLDDEPTLRSQLARLAGQLAQLDAAIHGHPYDHDAEEGLSLGEIRTVLSEAGPAFLTDVRAIVDEGRLDETFVDAVCDPPEVFTYGDPMRWVAQEA